MQNIIYNLDGGVMFGEWEDSVSKIMYAPNFIPKVRYNRVADYGGGNGLLRQSFPDSQYLSIDIDPTKLPNIVDDITTHRGCYDLIVLRYVLHYLSTEQAMFLFANLKRYHLGDLLVVQFVNDGEDLDIKREISNLASEDAQKFMRSTKELFHLLSGTNIKQVDSIDYVVTPEFYLNRLGVVTTKEHNERIYGILCTL